MQNFMEVSRRWYEKAVDCDDSFDQFISIWISFNAIYGRREGQELDKIKSITNEINDDTIKNILTYKEVKFFCDIVPSIRFLDKKQEIADTSEDQEKLKRNIDRNPRLALRNLMFILNKVRNNLFHGDKRIESVRDVDIVKNAYPIVREIVKGHLGLDDNMEPIRIEIPSNNSIEKALMIKIEDLQEEMSNIIDSFNTIPKDNKHPISILLDRINMQANGIVPGFTTPQQMEDIRKGLLKLYDQNKPEIIRDIEEVYHFVDKRMKDVIDDGCTELGVKQFSKEYLELQRKYLDKGYRFKV
ncbi:hypothetical protein SAMN05518871_107154 [Psychrobacillus sp. OK028]|uniref:hypothetical protein n=1 Tax=Psychrobacillus sp. OK028 TaxID=1884359 RepID=UPI0008877BF6|nr:hypothetical protein [Psychrobacillus sp. OK028]SDN76312.1 hypothetical protein SAMN05518871_107154 [Psychrobacillus sp. OK028]